MQQDIDEIDNSFGGGGEASAVSFTFLHGFFASDDLESLTASNIIGQITLINYRQPGAANYSLSYAFEAILTEPTIRTVPGNFPSLLNNFIYADKEFDLIIRAQIKKIRGIYYCQQNGVTNVCAHASLRMLVNTVSNGSSLISSQAIDAQLARLPSRNGFQLGDIETIINGTPGLQAQVINCQMLKPETYLSVLASIVESGHLALLVFTTGQTDEHVVPVFGHTRNSDEWHPEALPAYTGTAGAQYYPSSAWIDHFLIHDDNFGPYFTLSSRALQVDQNMTAHWIIAVRPTTPSFRPETAEAYAAVLIAYFTSGVVAGSGKWFNYMTTARWTYVLRTVLIDRSKYLDHLANLTDHDGLNLSQNEIAALASLPAQFWMVEFSLPSLYTGNRTKLGEVLLSTTAPVSNYQENVLAVRLPSLLIVVDPPGNLQMIVSTISSHTPIYQHRPQMHQW